MMQAKRTRFSPAGPMQATRVFGTPSSERMPSSVSDTVLPQKGRASRSSTWCGSQPSCPAAIACSFRATFSAARNTAPAPTPEKRDE